MAVSRSEQHIPIAGVRYYTLLENAAPNRPLILLIHALMSSHRMYDTTVPYLHRLGYATLRFDHVGHNLTPPPADPAYALTMDDIVTHMHALVEQITVGTEKKTLRLKAVLGCSIGGVLALRYAMLHPTPDLTRVVSVAAPGIASPSRAHDLWTRRIAQFEADVRAGGEVLCRATVERWIPGGREEDVDVREAALEHVRTCGIAGYKILADAIRGYDYDVEVEGLNVLGREGRSTCLIVAGREDGACEVEGLRRLAERIEGCGFVVMERTGHLPPMQKRAEFEGIVVPFLTA